MLICKVDTPHKWLGRKVLFKELLQIPKRERSVNPRKKVLTSHLLISAENQEKVRKAEEVSKKKEEKQIEKQNLIKTLILEDKKKKNIKKVTCRADTVKARSLPMMRRGGGRRGRGRFSVRGGLKL